MIGDNYTNNFLYKLLSIFPKENADTFNIVQIGANDGKTNDPIYHWVMDSLNLTSILLIEPQEDALRLLKSNYSSHPKCKIFKGAVGNNELISLFRIKEEFHSNYRGIIANGITSSNRDYVLKKIKKNLLISENQNPELFIEEIKIRSSPLKSIIDKLAFLMPIHLLQIDTEGYDDICIYNSNLDEFKPKIINYEFVHLSTERIKKLHFYLQSKGYKIIRWTSEDECALLDANHYNQALNISQIQYY
jgi:FkbM family methyltransferase